MRPSADVLVIGGGPAGAAAAIRLARRGLRVVLVERQAAVKPGVCGEFVSSVAALELTDLGISPAGLGGRPTVRTRVFSDGSAVSGRLPFTGYGLARTVLDGALLDLAGQSGVTLSTGSGVRVLERLDGVWTARLGDGRRIESGTVILATGKHELRGHPRSSDLTRPMIGFKMHYRLRPTQAESLGDAVELFLDDAGYAGLQRVAGDVANLCLVIAAEAVAGPGAAWSTALGRFGRRSPVLDERLRDARPLWPRPASIAHVPYGYTCSRADTPPGLYRVGDQAAVIPSLAGEGIAIALRSARIAADAILADHPVEVYLKTLRRMVRGPLRRAAMIEAAMTHETVRGLALRGAATPGVLATLARLTRLRAPTSCAAAHPAAL